MTDRYAAKTTVSAARTRAEIEETLEKFGSSRFGVMTEPGRAMVVFKIRERSVRIVLPLPDRDDDEFRLTNHKYPKRRDPDQAAKAWEQACRSHWRALLLVLRAKIEAINLGVSTFEHEFLAHIVMPDGRTVADHAVPMIAHAYETGETPPLLPAPERKH